MKKPASLFAGILFALLLVPPFASLFAAIFGYLLEPASFPAFFALRAALSVGLVLVCLLRAQVEDCSFSNNLFLCVFVFSFVYMQKLNTILAFVCINILFACSLFLLVKFWKLGTGGRFVYSESYRESVSKQRKRLAVIFALFVCVIIDLASGLFTFGHLRPDTVVQTVDSPSGAYQAQVINSQLSPSGRTTYVDVVPDSVVDTPVIKLYKEPKNIYTGDWREFEDIDLHWKDDTCLVINGTEYPVSF